jgi:hypothetical protein
MLREATGRRGAIIGGFGGGCCRLPVRGHSGATPRQGVGFDDVPHGRLDGLRQVGGDVAVVRVLLRRVGGGVGAGGVLMVERGEERRADDERADVVEVDAVEVQLVDAREPRHRAGPHAPVQLEQHVADRDEADRVPEPRAGLPQRAGELLEVVARLVRAVPPAGVLLRPLPRVVERVPLRLVPLASRPALVDVHAHVRAPRQREVDELLGDLHVARAVVARELPVERLERQHVPGVPGQRLRVVAGVLPEPAVRVVEDPLQRRAGDHVAAVLVRVTRRGDHLLQRGVADRVGHAVADVVDAERLLLPVGRGRRTGRPPGTRAGRGRPG